jgi:F-box protein 11
VRVRTRGRVDVTSDMLVDALREVVRLAGIQVATTDDRRVRGYLSDLIAGSPAHVRVAVIAVAEGIPGDLMKATASGLASLAVSRGSERLAYEHGIDHRLATDVVQAWQRALDPVGASTTRPEQPAAAPVRPVDVRKELEGPAPATSGAGAMSAGWGGTVSNDRAIVVDLSGAGRFLTIRNAIRAAGNGGVIRVKPGTYRQALVLHGNVSLVADGPPGTVIVEATGAPAIEIRGGTPVVRGLTVRTVGHVGADSTAGVLISGGAPVLDLCDVTSSVGDGVVVQGGEARPTIRDCTFQGARGSGVVVRSGAHGTFERCTVTGNGSAGFIVNEGSDPVARDCMIINGKSAGVFVHSKGRGTFERCTVTGNEHAGVAVRDGGDPTFRDCTLTDGKDAGLYVYDGGKGAFERCTVSRNAKAGVTVDDGGGPILTDCGFERNGWHGVDVRASGGATLIGCRAVGNATGDWSVEAGARVTRRDATLEPVSPAPVPTGGPEIVVDQSGGGRFLTITNAVKAARAGTTVKVRRGTYRESVVLNGSVVLASDGQPGTVIIESTGAPAIEVQSGSPVVRGLTLRTRGTSAWVPAIRVVGGTPLIEACAMTSLGGVGLEVRGMDADPRVINAKILGSGGGVLVHGGGKGTFDRCVVANSTYAGFQVGDGAKPSVRNSVISDGMGAGIHVSRGGRGLFEQCRVTGNALAGLEVRDGGDPTVRNCVVSQNRGHGVAIRSDGLGTFTGNTLHGNSKGDWLIEAGAKATRRGN